MCNIPSLSYAGVKIFIDGGLAIRCWRLKKKIKLDKGYTIDIENLIEDHSCEETASLSLHLEEMKSSELKNASIG